MMFRSNPYWYFDLGPKTPTQRSDPRSDPFLGTLKTKNSEFPIMPTVSPEKEQQEEMTIMFFAMPLSKFTGGRQDLNLGGKVNDCSLLSCSSGAWMPKRKVFDGVSSGLMTLAVAGS